MEAFQISIYELLVRRGCPEPIAELIASRCDGECTFNENDTIQMIVAYGLYWYQQPEGDRFWSSFYSAIEAEESVMYPKLED